MGTEVIQVPVRRGGEVVAHALVDGDFAWMLDCRWHFAGGYPAMGKASKRMHVIVMGGMADHINGDPLDNRRENLRLCTQAENKQNVPSRGGASDHRGVYFDRRRRKWYGQVKHQGKRRCTPYVETEEEAVAAIGALRQSLLPFAVAGR